MCTSLVLMAVPTPGTGIKVRNRGGYDTNMHKCNNDELIFKHHINHTCMHSLMSNEPSTKAVYWPKRA